MLAISKRFTPAAITAALSLTLFSIVGCASTTTAQRRWGAQYDRLLETPPIVFHYNHGVLAGSYPDDAQTAPVEFDDVCGALGHVCLCGAGGFQIARQAVQNLSPDAPPERGEFILISGRDHTVADVVALVLGLPRRDDPQKSRVFIDDSIAAPRREYHYYIAYPPAKTAVQIVYRKHLLVGNEEMDRLWKIETGYDESPSTVPPPDVERYRRAMFGMVHDVLLERTPGLITVKPIEYSDFQQHLRQLKS